MIPKKQLEQEILLKHSDFNPALTPKQFSKYLKEIHWARENKTNEIIELTEEMMLSEKFEGIEERKMGYHQALMELQTKIKGDGK